MGRGEGGWRPTKPTQPDHFSALWHYTVIHNTNQIFFRNFMSHFMTLFTIQTIYLLKAHIVHYPLTTHPWRGESINNSWGDCVKRESPSGQFWHHLTRSLKSTTTQPAVGGPKTFWEDQRAWRPKSLETKKLDSSKGWGDQSAEKTKNWRDDKYLSNR